ncbi:REP-associated tyrosine transposase [Luteimonas wenzhouensis]|uniref:Transposase n=1 Tax=Luteimonas wenzhouensis TaxID=2599615 RepID=A0A5C5TT97_9GAMM|nr:transposase [Luteimonas wenzhouensis]TWT17194.1 transposase [Luteimonas wenzhouensis]
MDRDACGRRGHAALRKGRVSLPRHVYHVTFATRDRESVFADFVAACAAARTFALPVQGFSLLAWVLMPDHAHCLLQLGNDGSLGTASRILKGRSAHAVNRECRRSGGLWARGYHDRALRREDDLQAVARYIVANPVRAGLVRRVADYPFWDAVWLGGRG